MSEHVGGNAPQPPKASGYYSDYSCQLFRWFNAAGHRRAEEAKARCPERPWQGYRKTTLEEGVNAMRAFLRPDRQLQCRRRTRLGIAIIRATDDDLVPLDAEAVELLSLAGVQYSQDDGFTVSGPLSQVPPELLISNDTDGTETQS